jgi:hypothetical protein
MTDDLGGGKGMGVMVAVEGKEGLMNASRCDAIESLVLVFSKFIRHKLKFVTHCTPDTFTTPHEMQCT